MLLSGLFEIEVSKTFVFVGFGKLLTVMIECEPCYGFYRWPKVSYAQDCELAFDWLRFRVLIGSFLLDRRNKRKADPEQMTGKV